MVPGLILCCCSVTGQATLVLLEMSEGLRWDGGCWQGTMGIGNSSAKTRKNLGVRGTGEGMQLSQCGCAVYHFF